MKTPALSPRSSALGLRRAPGRRARRNPLALLAPFLACATLSHAALLLQENFDTLDAGSLNGKNLWTAESGVNVVAGGISYTNGGITISGGTHHVQSAVIGTTATPLATKSFASQSGEVWFSFTLRVDSSVSASRYWFWVADNTDIASANSGFTGAVSTNNTGNKAIYSEVRQNTAAAPVASGSSVVDGNIYFFVGRVSKDGPATNANAYDRMELWVNPASISLGAATISERTDTATLNLSQFGLTAIGTAATLNWDNLLIGTTQADVLNVYAIPEPATFAALGGLAALGLAVLRRRRD